MTVGKCRRVNEIEEKETLLKKTKKTAQQSQYVQNKEKMKTAKMKKIHKWVMGFCESEEEGLILYCVDCTEALSEMKVTGADNEMTELCSFII